MVALPLPGGSQERGGNEEQLRRELDAVKQQLQRLEDQLKRQDELLRQQGGPRPAPVAPAPSAPTPTPILDEEAIRRKILSDLQPLLAAANKTFPSQFNPAIGFIVDTAFSSSRKDRSNFEFRSGELGISASVDPFARAYAIINGRKEGIDVEEAAIVTTSLPWNLTVKGGRFFAEFGRLSSFHDHDLPFVNRPLVLDNFIGGESQSDGVEVNWLAPIPHYLSVTVGAYNKIGASNDRIDNTVPRDMSEFGYLARVSTSFSLTDSQSIDVGASDAYTPEVRAEGLKPRNLFGVDFIYRYTPLASAAYRGLVWGTELLVNHEARPGIPPTDDMPKQIFRYRDAFGMYRYVEARLTRRFYPGFLYEYVQDIDQPNRPIQQFSPYLTIWPSEFQRIRLQYTRVENLNRTDDQFFMQWTAVIGSHVHTFRDR